MQDKSNHTTKCEQRNRNNQDMPCICTTEDNQDKSKRLKDYDLTKARGCLEYLKDIQEDHAVAAIWAAHSLLINHVQNGDPKVKAAVINSKEFIKLMEDFGYLLL